MVLVQWEMDGKVSTNGFLKTVTWATEWRFDSYIFICPSMLMDGQIKISHMCKEDFL